MMKTTDIVASASSALFGKPLVTNVYRSVIAEAIVAAALPDWEWCSADYAAYDFIHPDGQRLEVKQSALRQSWETTKPARPAWDVRPRTGYWSDPTTWVDMPGRNADIYVLALHIVIDGTADHRDPSQWQFFVISTAALPATKTIGRSTAVALAHPVDMEHLAQAVERVRGSLLPEDMSE